MATGKSYVNNALPSLFVANTPRPYHTIWLGMVPPRESPGIDKPHGRSEKKRKLNNLVEESLIRVESKKRN